MDEFRTSDIIGHQTDSSIIT